MLVSSTATGHGPLPGSVAANTKPLAVQVTGVFGGASGVLEVLFPDEPTGLTVAFVTLPGVWALRSGTSTLLLEGGGRHEGGGGDRGGDHRRYLPGASAKRACSWLPPLHWCCTARSCSGCFNAAATAFSPAAVSPRCCLTPLPLAAEMLLPL